MRSIQSIALLFGIILCSLILLCPPAIVPAPLSGEIWLYQAIVDLHKGLHLVPSLNGLPIIGENPVNIILLALPGFTDIFSLRLVSLLFGCIVVSAVFLMSTALWDMKSGLVSGALTMTSLGFVLTHSTINTWFIPCSLGIIAFAVFSVAYIKESPPWRYIPAYVLVGISAITGGWSFLAFFAFSVILLILLDLSPKRLLGIRAVTGIVIITLILASVYLTYRIMAGHAVASSLFPDLENTGMFSRLWALVKFSLPWLFLVIPAWIHTETISEQGIWRTFLPAKIAFVMGALILMFSPDHRAGYAVLGIPFFCMITGYWMAHGFILPEKLQPIRTVVLLLTATILMGSAIATSAIHPIRTLSITVGEAIPLVFFAGALLFMLYLVKKQFISATLTLCIGSVFVLVWSMALMQLPARTQEPLSAIKDMTTYAPLIVYRDDLTMRGYIEHAGIRPIVVGREVVPIGEIAYLAASTDDLEDLIEDLGSRMHTELISSYDNGETFALIRLSLPASVE